VIVGFNDETIQDAHDLPALVAKTPVGEHVTVTLRRDGKTQIVPVTIGKLPAEQGTGDESSQAAPSQWGLQLQDVTPQMARQRGLQEDGVMVVGVQPGSPAERAGLQRGDIIREVNRQPVQSAQEVRDAIAKADNQDTVALLVKRNKGSVFVAMAK
jgi:serine protease Do